MLQGFRETFPYPINHWVLVHQKRGPHRPPFSYPPKELEMRYWFLFVALFGLLGCGQQPVALPLDKQAPKDSAMKSMQNQMETQMMPGKK